MNSSGQLGVVSSSRRYKDNIEPMHGASERIYKLRPVTFRYRQPDEKGDRPEQYGLIAEEVAMVMPELVVYNEKGQPETVAYQMLVPLLLNELQREHKLLAAQSRQLGIVRAQVTDVGALRAEVADLHRLTNQLVASREQDGQPLQATVLPAVYDHALALSMH